MLVRIRSVLLFSSYLCKLNREEPPCGGYYYYIIIIIIIIDLLVI